MGCNFYKFFKELFFIEKVFDPMKKANPDYKKKITLIPGDVTLPNLGISQSDREILKEEVTIVFHGAATVRFDEKLKTAIEVNVYGTKQMMQLCAECRNLLVRNEWMTTVVNTTIQLHILH